MGRACGGSPISRSRQYGQRLLIGDRRLTLCIRQECGLTQTEQQVAAPVVILMKEFERQVVVGDCLPECGGSHSLVGSSLRIGDTACPVAALCEVECEFGQLVHAQGLLGVVSRFEYPANGFVQPATARGAHLSIQALPDFIVAEGEDAHLIGANQSRPHGFKEVLLENLGLLVFDGCQQREIERAADDRRDAQEIDDGW